MWCPINFFHCSFLFWPSWKKVSKEKMHTRRSNVNVLTISNLLYCLIIELTWPMRLSWIFIDDTSIVIWILFSCAHSKRETNKLNESNCEKTYIFETYPTLWSSGTNESCAMTRDDVSLRTNEWNCTHNCYNKYLQNHIKDRFCKLVLVAYMPGKSAWVETMKV